MTLRSATVTGAGDIVGSQQIDSSVCDCCPTDTTISNGVPLAVYRDRTADEVRDIYVSRFADGNWQPGVPVSNDGWVIEGCPVNGPAIDALDSLVAVAWFTGANNAPRVYAAVSGDGGQTFADPLEISRGRTLGRVGVSVVNAESYVVSWMDHSPQNDFDIKVRALTTDGQVGPPWTVGKTSAMRTVPQLTRIGDQLVMAWTDEVGDTSEVVSVRMAITNYFEGD